MCENLSGVTEAKIQRLIERLYVENDNDHRGFFQTLLLTELRRYQPGQGRRKLLQPLLRDWETRIPKYQALLDEQKTAGVATDEAQKLLDNLVCLHKLLDGVLNAEPDVQPRPFG